MACPLACNTDKSFNSTNGDSPLIGVFFLSLPNSFYYSPARSYLDANKAKVSFTALGLYLSSSSFVNGSHQLHLANLKANSELPANAPMAIARTVAQCHFKVHLPLLVHYLSRAPNPATLLSLLISAMCQGVKLVR